MYFQLDGAYICNTFNEVVNIIQSYVGREEAILSVYMCPSSLINNTSGTLQYSGQENPTNSTQIINKPSSLNGYTPVNKKLLTFPFCFLNVSNNNGTNNTYQYELFNEIEEAPNECIFNIKGVPTIGGSVKCNPINYKNSQEFQNEEEGLMAGKFPTLSWSDDEYINWLTQNSVNIGIGVASNLLTIVGGVGMMSTGVGALAGASSVVSRWNGNCKYFTVNFMNTV